jgi:hypothetical protein
MLHAYLIAHKQMTTQNVAWTFPYLMLFKSWKMICKIAIFDCNKSFRPFFRPQPFLGEEKIFSPSKGGTLQIQRIEIQKTPTPNDSNPEECQVQKYMKSKGQNSRTHELQRTLFQRILIHNPAYSKGQNSRSIPTPKASTPKARQFQRTELQKHINSNGFYSRGVYSRMLNSRIKPIPKPCTPESCQLQGLLLQRKGLNDSHFRES